MIPGILFLLLYPMTKLCQLLNLMIMAFCVPSLAHKTYAYWPDDVPPTVLKNGASVLTHCTVKPFRLRLSNFIFPSYWMQAYLHSVPKKDGRLNPLTTNLHISCLSKALETILNNNIFKHLSTFNFVSDYHHGFCRGHFNGDLTFFN